jgi:hypothetical protein
MDYDAGGGVDGWRDAIFRHFGVRLRRAWRRKCHVTLTSNLVISIVRYLWIYHFVMLFVLIFVNILTVFMYINC